MKKRSLIVVVLCALAVILGPMRLAFADRAGMPRLPRAFQMLGTMETAQAARSGAQNVRWWLTVYDYDGHDFSGRVTMHAADGRELGAGDVRGEIEDGVAEGKVYDAFGEELAEFACDLSVIGQAAGWFEIRDGQEGRLRWARSIREDEEIRELRERRVSNREDEEIRELHERRVSR